MKYYLVFDSQCSVCNQVATTARTASNHKLDILGIQSSRAKELLDLVYPQGWKHMPYLLRVENNQVKAWSNIGLTLQLIKHLGLRDFIRFWNSASIGSSTDSPIYIRRQLLKAGLGLGFLSLGMLSPKLSTPVLASHTGNCPCHPCTGECTQTGSSTSCICLSSCAPNCICPVHRWSETTCYCYECGNYYMCYSWICNWPGCGEGCT